MMQTVAVALARAREVGVARLDAQVLMAQVLGRDRAWLIAHGEHPLTAQERASFEAALGRRAAGEPLAYLTGEREFRGLALRVDGRVLVPRPETEGLVDWALERLDAMTDIAQPEVVDLGTGSGAIALAIAAACPRASVIATDASPDALDIAAANALRLGLPLRLCGGSWWSALDGSARFHLAVSNPPYIAGDDAHLAALGHEPRMALTPGADGLSALFEIIEGAGAHLLDGAWLLLEHGHDQAQDVRGRLSARGFDEVETRRDLAGVERCSGGRWRGR